MGSSVRQLFNNTGILHATIVARCASGAAWVAQAGRITDTVATALADIPSRPTGLHPT